MYSPEFFRPKGFKTNRHLDQEERDNELSRKEELTDFDDTVPHYQLSVIQQNSTFVELTDRDYAIRGVCTMMALAIIVGMFWICSAMALIEARRWVSFHEAKNSGALGFVIFTSFMGLVCIIPSLYGLFRESFSYTHFPIRLNRRNRKIYVWRRDGSVMSAAWDKVFFYVRCYKKTGVHMWDIVGHVLEDDRQTVKDSFALSSYTSSDAIDLQLHWEYFRRYMEDGPAQPYRMLKICLPIAKRRETWWEGFMRLSLLLHGSIIMQVLATPFNLPASFGRMFAMRTSKIPRWPDWVEQECSVASDDPYVRESGYEAPRTEPEAA
jgi:hypothetical protein